MVTKQQSLSLFSNNNLCKADALLVPILAKSSTVILCAFIFDFTLGKLKVVFDIQKLNV